MAHVELAGDVGGRHDNGEGLLLGVPVALEAAAFLPGLVDTGFHLLGLIDLWQFFFHKHSPISMAVLRLGSWILCQDIL